MESNVLEQKIDEILDLNKRDKSNRFNRFRGELFILEEAYEENPDNLTNEQKKKLSKLEMKLGHLRLGMAGFFAGAAVGCGIATYANVHDIVENGVTAANLLNSTFWGVETLLTTAGSAIWAYLSSIPYRKGRDINYSEAQT